MSYSLIINTACMDPLVPYRHRRELLGETLEWESKQGWNEIFVVGTYKEGRGYTYLPFNPVYRDRRDALWQREFAARTSTGDVLVFMHDDHQLAMGFLQALESHDRDWDLLVPARFDAKDNPIDNGSKADPPYMGGHALAMRRALWAKVPWTSVDTEWWDLPMTRIWKEHGARIVYTDKLQHVSHAPEDQLVP